MKIILAKFSGKCAKSGKKIKPGDMVVYDFYTKATYLPKHAPHYEVNDVGGFIRK